MTPEDLPVVGTLFTVDARTPVYDALMALGPLLVVLVAVVGRSPATVALAAGYVLALPVYVVVRRD